MSTNWIPYPRPGTSVLDGRWLCSLVTEKSQLVEILELVEGEWIRDGQPLPDTMAVTHIDFVPQPGHLSLQDFMKWRAR